MINHQIQQIPRIRAKRKNRQNTRKARKVPTAKNSYLNNRSYNMLMMKMIMIRKSPQQKKSKKRTHKESANIFKSIPRKVPQMKVQRRIHTVT